MRFARYLLVVLLSAHSAAATFLSAPTPLSGFNAAQSIIAADRLHPLARIILGQPNKDAPDLHECGAEMVENTLRPNFAVQRWWRAERVA